MWRGWDGAFSWCSRMRNSGGGKNRAGGFLGTRETAGCSNGDSGWPSLHAPCAAPPFPHEKTSRRQAEGSSPPPAGRSRIAPVNAPDQEDPSPRVIPSSLRVWFTFFCLCAFRCTLKQHIHTRSRRETLAVRWPCVGSANESKSMNKIRQGTLLENSMSCSRAYHDLINKKMPRLLFPRDGANYWRRPTFAQPIEALSSGLQRLTSVFGMGTGGATALGSPEV